MESFCTTGTQKKSDANSVEFCGHCNFEFEAKDANIVLTYIKKLVLLSLRKNFSVVLERES